MALSRFLAAALASVMLCGTPVLANEIQDINLQFRKGELAGALDHANRYLAKNPRMRRRAFSRD